MSISVKDFEIAIRDFDMQSLEIELGRLVNSLAHLEESNRAIETHIQDLVNSNNNEDDISVFQDAIQENLLVIRRQEEKTRKVKERMELVDRAAHPSQRQSKPPSDGDGSVYL